MHEGPEAQGSRPGKGPRVSALAIAPRLAVGVLLAWCVFVALVAPELPRVTAALGLLTFLAALWQPSAALVAVAAFTPAGLLLAPSPAHAAELLAWAFLSGWLLRLWRPLAGAGWSTGITWPTVLYGACVLASWKAVTIAGATGVDTSALVAYLAHAVTPQFLIFANTDPFTWTAVQMVTGLSLFLAAQALARTDASLARRVAVALGVSMALLGVASCVDVVRQWAANGYAVSYLLRYTAGERFTLHLADLNAAGSQYVLAAGIALGLAAQSLRRWPWLLLLVLILPAFWLTGSRTAVVALAGSAALIAAVRSRTTWRITRTQIIAAGTVVTLLIGGVAAVAVFGGNERGSAGRALRLRTEFSETSLRMLASAPVFGVGVGGYFPRSSEFMPPEIKALYGAENAHNYFAQQFAELGMVGGALFVWLSLAALAAGWQRARAQPQEPALVALFAGCAGYLLTCITGHPFLVSEAAFPFWIALGVLVSTTDAPRATGRRVAITLLVAALLIANVGRGLLAYTNTKTAPPESGFEAPRTADDGRVFRWMAPRATTSIPSGLGFLRMIVRAPDLTLTRAVTVETSVSGRVVDRRELPAGQWVTIEIPVRTPASGPFRRVDVRATPFWTESRKMARRTALIAVPLSVMVAEVEWVPARR